MNKLKKVVCVFLSMTKRRKDNYYVFGSWWGNKFADNPKYLYLHMFSQGKNVMWVTKNEAVLNEMARAGYPVCMADSPEGIKACATAKYIIYCTGTADVNEYYIGGAVLVNLWHGIPLKKIMYDDNVNSTHKKLKSKIWDAITYLPYKKKYVVATSETVADIYEHAFRINRDHLPVWGQPRNDCFFDGSLTRKRYSYQNYEKLCVYMPTHRNEGKTSIDIDKIFDLDRLNEICKQNKTLFLIKKHYYHAQEITDLSEYPFIIDCTTEQLDTQELLYNADYLITDYSSCYIDYLLLNRPIIFYAYDFQHYLLDDREMYFEYEKVTPGSKAYDFTSFLVAFEKVISGQDEWKMARHDIVNLFYNEENQNLVSPNIAQKINNL